MRMTADRAADLLRVAQIDSYGVLDTKRRLDLVGLVELAARACGVPMATINLITDTHQHQVAAYGFDASICRREDSMCARVLDAETPVVVTDASRDERFRDNPFVTGVIGEVRFYASHQLITPAGITIGTLCVFDTVPRDIEEPQIQALGTLADRIVDVLELTVRSRQLAASNERLTAFAGRVSHDLKSPLTSVALSLGMAREQIASGGDPSEAEWLLDRAIKGSQRMAALIDQVLDYATLDGHIEAAPVDLATVLADVRDDLRGVLDGVQVTSGALPVVLGDEVQLHSVLQNVVDNASKYRHPDRPLAVSVSAEEAADGRWRIAVSDNGVGIPPEERKRVFEPRVRLRNDARGWGIGLDTCRRVVEAHGGTIALTGNPSGGTTVVFELPAV